MAPTGDTTGTRAWTRWSDQIHGESNQEERKTLCSEVQKIFADELPYIVLWFTDVVSVDRRDPGDLNVSPAGDYDQATAFCGGDRR